MGRGKHVILDGLVIRDNWPTNEDLLSLLEESVIVGKATLLDSRLISLPCKKSKANSPPGGTAWLGLDESAVVLHWYVHEDTVEFALDAFTCGETANSYKIVSFFQEKLQAKPIGKLLTIDRFNYENS